MNFDSPDLLYALLPEEYRTRDAQEGYPLRALLQVIGGQVRRMKADIDQLYDNLFVETAQPWVIPYIGDLVGSRPLEGDARRLRADVAHTIAYRRRKGTLAMLQELAADVTGWPARVVDFYELLGWTQNLNHLRPGVNRTPDLRRTGTATRTVDVRPQEPRRERPNLPNVGFYLWRLGAYPVASATPYGLGSGRYTFSPLGLEAPLFRLPAPGEADAMPEPIAPPAFRAAVGDYYGPGRSLLITADGAPVPTEAIIPRDLRQWAPPPAGKVAVDVTTGRFCFAPDQDPTDLQVAYTYGFSQDLGGGPYLRPPGPLDELPATHVVTGGGQGLKEALADWNASGLPDAVIEIRDSATYAGDISLRAPDRSRLIIRAAYGERPAIRVDGSSRNIQIAGNSPGAALHLIGLCIDGGIRIAEGIGHLTISHCTLVPRLKTAGDPDAEAADAVHPSLIAIATAASNLRVSVDHSITGLLRLSDKLVSLQVADSIIDGGEGMAITGALQGFGPATVLSHVTVLGRVKVRELDAIGVIFREPVTVQRTQAGSVRNSCVAPGTETPGRFQCVTDQVPTFTAIRYGQPAYGQLALTCPASIRAGAEDGAEMGAFHELQQPQRERNLANRLLEYLPVGREPGLIYVT